MKQKEYSNDTILQTLACCCVPFSRSDVLNVARALGHKKKSSNGFIYKYSAEHVVMEEKRGYDVSVFYINPVVWKDIIAVIEPEHINPIVQIVRSTVIGSHPEFALAYYQFMRGESFQAAMKQVNTNSSGIGYLQRIVSSLFNPASSGPKRNLPFLMYLNGDCLRSLYEYHYVRLVAFNFSADDFECIDKLYANNPNFNSELKEKIVGAVGFYRHFVGDADRAIAEYDASSFSKYDISIEAFSCLQRGEYNKAAKLFLEYLKIFGAICFSEPILNFYYAVALVNSTLAAAQKMIKNLLQNPHVGEHESVVLKILLLISQGKKSNINIRACLGNVEMFSEKILLTLVCKHYHLLSEPPYSDVLDKVDEKGLRLMQIELSSDFERYQDIPANGIVPTLLSQIDREEWEIKLDELLVLNGCHAAGRKAAPKSVAMQRIAYMVNTADLHIQPKLQKSKDGISWTAGRNIALEKLQAGKVDGMSELDRRVGSCVESYGCGWYSSNVSYSLSGVKAIAAMVGHPYVFDEQSGVHLDIIAEKPQLSVKLAGNRYVVTSNVDTGKVENDCFVQIDGSEIKVMKVNAKLLRTIVELKSVRIPEKAKEKLTVLLKNLSGESVVMSDLLNESDDIATIEPHPETIVRLQPAGEGFRCQIAVRPFGDVPPLCKPGKGMQTITTTINGRQVLTKRNLKKERECYEQVEQMMTDFDENAVDTYLWDLTPEDCLMLLERLQGRGDIAIVEWPEGEKLRVMRASIKPGDIKVKIKGVASWFELSGDIQISEEKKVKIAELVEKAAQAKGSFIQLSDHEFVRLTSELRRQIDIIGRVATIEKGKVRLSSFNAPMLENLADSGVPLEADKTFRQLVERIGQSNAAEIKIPKNINADLRSYQKDGFFWMSRLALWGAGALLADDMGLGKTLQAIALLLSRAAQGPQLVVVPTSVVMNWRDEIQRFAPSLNVKILNISGEQRKAVVKKAKAFDIVVATYGLLSNEEEILTSLVWNTIVLDEAHNIKNRDTKMSQAAMKLQADFRLLLTGTPLQNHVSEIWNLMQFANPGLLGTFQAFTERFLLPIERDHDKESQRQLKRIITPFILRRTKSEVLSELPEKTEITLQVEMSPEEWAFYDNIRQKAIAEMEDNAATAVQALAEITRLRQAVCNVRLVEASLHIPSSKLERFMQLVAELHSNHHRALVFSQFTSHLALVRQRLDSEGISYLYLDGSVTAKERIRLVEEFQHGDMPLFLISLKAGGVGLNLTAADYVVHLDPWWNPAIEDQASDRAYRIGQHKSVTVYRLIATGTIEEKIIHLHQTKKNMADALLEGGDISAGLSREELVELLKAAMS